MLKYLLKIFKGELSMAEKKDDMKKEAATAVFKSVIEKLKKKPKK